MTDLELVELIRAGIAEDEAEINKHPDDPFDIDGYSATQETGYPCNEILTIGKKRALREIEAKRRMLDELYPSVRLSDETIADEWHNDPGDSDKLLELLALPYLNR